MFFTICSDPYIFLLSYSILLNHRHQVIKFTHISHMQYAMHSPKKGFQTVAVIKQISFVPNQHLFFAD